MASYVRRSKAPKASRRRSPGRELQSKNTARRASPAQKRAADNARRRAAQAKRRRGSTTPTSGRGSGRKPGGANVAKRRSPAPKKDTRKTGGQGGAKGAVDQMAFQRFIKMTPAQQRHVMRMSGGEHRRRTR